MGISSGLRIRKFEAGGHSIGGLAHECSVGAERLTHSAYGGLRIPQPRNVEASSKLMCSMPVPGYSGQTSHGLNAAAVLMQVLEIVAARAVGMQHERLGALRNVFEDATIRRDSEFEKRVPQPYLILERTECPVLFRSHRRRLRIQSIQAEVCAMRSVIEETRVQNVLWCDVVLQSQKIVSRPFHKSIGAPGLLFDDPKGMLHADRIGKPKAPLLDGSGKGQPRIPVT